MPEFASANVGEASLAIKSRHQVWPSSLAIGDFIVWVPVIACALPGMTGQVGVT
jgi:hypothetical protein